MTERPEDAVIAEIDELVEWQLAQPIVDDYQADRYVKCRLCGEDFHGLKSYTGCPGECATEDEQAAWRARPRPSNHLSGSAMDLNYPQRYVLGDGDPMIPGIDVHLGGREPAWIQNLVPGIVPEAPWLPVHQMNTDQSGSAYTLADIEAMRTRPRMRFSAVDPMTRFTRVLEGILQVVSYLQTGLGDVTVNARLLPTQQHVIGPGQETPDIPEGMIAVDGEIPDGYEPLGMISADDLTIHEDCEYVEQWGGRRMMVSAEATATIEFHSATFGPAMDWLR